MKKNIYVMDTHHHHNHQHHHHHEISASMSKIFIFCIALNLLFVGIETVVGLLYNSVGLLSDAGHNLSDVFSLVLVLVAFRMSKAASTPQFTYGYKKTTILISLINALILLVAVGAIIIESIYKLKNPQPISGIAISWTAGVGILINGLTTWLLMGGSKQDINVKGAYLHMLMDTLVSVGVVISGIIISYTDWVWIDPVIGIVLAIIIMFSTYNLLKESLLMTLDAVPSSVDKEHIIEDLRNYNKIESWHHLHIWAISTTDFAATIHIVLKELSDMENVKTEVREIFHKSGVHHCTIETETEGTECQAYSCK